MGAVYRLSTWTSQAAAQQRRRPVLRSASSHRLAANRGAKYTTTWTQLVQPLASKVHLEVTEADRKSWHELVAALALSAKAIAIQAQRLKELRAASQVN